MENNFKVKFKINEVKWSMEFVGGDSEVLKDNGNENLGTTHITNKLIFIDKSLGNSDLKSTVVHELVHAFIWEFGFHQVQLTQEVVCDMFGIYGERIIKLANRLIKEFKNEVSSQADAYYR